MSDDETLSIQEAVARAMGSLPGWECLEEGLVGPPRQVLTPDGRPASWIVPIVVGEMACGFAHVGLDGRVARVGTFGAGDSSSWVPASFFNEPPKGAMEEVSERYAPRSVGEPVLSYDRTPAKWGWRVELVDGDGGERVVMIGPWGWYDVPEVTTHPDTEG